MYFIISQHTLSIVERIQRLGGFGLYHHHRDAAQVNVLVASLLIFLCWQIDVGRWLKNYIVLNRKCVVDQKTNIFI